jgi:threonine/homoserine/homoserine lactone efflux protein
VLHARVDEVSGSSFGVFVAAALILLVTPGPSVLYIVARSIDEGARAGLVSVVGMAAGGIFHVAAAALGMSAVLMSSALAFAVVKYVGAGYLVYLGVRTLLGACGSVEIGAPARRSLRRRLADHGMHVRPTGSRERWAGLPHVVA